MSSPTKRCSKNLRIRELIKRLSNKYLDKIVRSSAVENFYWEYPVFDCARPDQKMLESLYLNVC
jgi:hypothetical protein